MDLKTLEQWAEYVDKRGVETDTFIRIEMHKYGFILTYRLAPTDKHLKIMTYQRIISFNEIETGHNLESLKALTDKYLRGLHMQYVQVLNIAKQDAQDGGRSN